MLALVIVLVMSQLSGTPKPHSCMQRYFKTFIMGDRGWDLEVLKTVA
jgi:hypothetical protein